MLHKLLLFALLGFPSSLLSQTLTLTDSLSGHPVSGVFVQNTRTEQTAISNYQGQLELPPSQPADTLLFSHVSYYTQMLPFRTLREQGFCVQLMERTVNLNEILLSANKWEQERKYIPNQVVGIGPAEIAFQQPQTTADLLGRTGQVFIQKSQMGGGSPMIRGFAANSLLIVVDGVRMNNAIYRGGNLQNVIALDANMLESAEVIMGPGSVMYGSDALGGVMDFHTRIPAFSESDNTQVRGEGLLRFASANREMTGSAQVELQGDRWATFTGITYTDFDDLRAGSNRPSAYPDWGKRPEYVQRIEGEDRVIPNPDPDLQVGTGYGQLNLLQKFRWQPAPKHELGWATHYSRTSEVPRYDRLTQYRNGALRNAEWYYYPQTWAMHQLYWKARPAQAFADDFRVSLSAQLVEEGRNDRRFGQAQRRERLESVTVYSLNADFRKEWQDGKHQFFYGAEVVANRVDSEARSVNIETGTAIPESTRYPSGGSQMHTAAIYANHKWLANERLTFTAGIRYNFIDLMAKFSDTTFFNFPFQEAALRTASVNGSMGMVYRPTQNWQFNLNLASGFRAPNIDDVGKVFDSSPGSVVVPNPNLRPENVYSVEMGFSTLQAEAVKLEFTAWYAQLTDAMVRRDFSFNGQDSILYDGQPSQVQAIVNTGAAFLYGLSMAAKWEISPKWLVQQTFNFTEGEDVNNGLPLRHVPPIFGQGMLRFKHKTWTAALTLDWNAKKPASDIPPEELDKENLYITGVGTPAWYDLSLRLSKRIGQHLQAQVGLENITDRHYRPYSSGISAAGRNLVLAIRGNF